MDSIVMRPVWAAAALCLTFWNPSPAFSQSRPVPQPQKIWGAVDVTLYRNSPKYFSDSGNHYLVYQADGNLVIRTKTEQFVWGLNVVTTQFGSTQSISFANGNIVARDQNANIVWQAIAPPITQGMGSAPARPFLTDTGVLRMFYCRTTGPNSTTGGGVFWASDKKTGHDLTSGKGCGEILGGPPPQSGAPVVKVFVDEADVTRCDPDAGWSKCLKMGSPSIRIMGTARVTDSAMRGVANTYAAMTKRLQQKYWMSKLDNFKVYLTNGEPWTSLETLKPVGTMWPDKTGQMSGNYLRGGASMDFLWIEEQMICKTGVVTRNEDAKNGLGTPEDKSPRALDQVVHEFAHSIDNRYALRSQVESVFAKDPSGAVEAFPQNVQQWFGAGGGHDTPGATKFMEELFTTRINLSCEGYNSAGGRLRR